MNAETFCEHFATFADAPNGVEKLRAMILQLAVQGKVVEQEANEEPASELLSRIDTERSRRIEVGELRESAEDCKVDTTILPFELPSSWQWVRLGWVGLCKRWVLAVPRLAARRST